MVAHLAVQLLALARQKLFPLLHKVRGRKGSFLLLAHIGVVVLLALGFGGLSLCCFSFRGLAGCIVVLACGFCSCLLVGIVGVFVRIDDVGLAAGIPIPIGRFLVLSHNFRALRTLGSLLASATALALAFEISSTSAS